MYDHGLFIPIVFGHGSFVLPSCITGISSVVSSVSRPRDEILRVAQLPTGIKTDVR